MAKNGYTRSPCGHNRADGVLGLAEYRVPDYGHKVIGCTRFWPLLNGKYSNGLSGAVYYAASMENLLWRWKNPGKLQGNTSQYYYHCCTDDLTVMDSSQRVWTSTFYIVYLPCYRRTGGQYPTSLLMLVAVTVVLLFKNKLKAPRPSEHPPPVKNVNLSHITACKESGPWSHRKIILARREVGN